MIPIGRMNWAIPPWLSRIAWIASKFLDIPTSVNPRNDWRRYAKGLMIVVRDFNTTHKCGGLKDIIIVVA